MSEILTKGYIVKKGRKCTALLLLQTAIDSKCNAIFCKQKYFDPLLIK